LALQESLLENSSGFQENIDSSIGEMQALVSNFSQRNRELDVGLVRLSRGISAQDFVPLLAKKKFTAAWKIACKRISGKEDGLQILLPFLNESTLIRRYSFCI